MNVAQVLPKCNNDDVTILLWRKKKHCVLRTALSVSERGDVFRILLYIFISGPELTPRVEVVSHEGKTQVRDQKSVMFLLFL